MIQTLPAAILVLAAAWLTPKAEAGTTAVPDDVRDAYDAYMASSPITTVSASAASRTNAATLRAAIQAGNVTTRLISNTRQRCPKSCSVLGSDTSDWYAYHSLERLGHCTETMLLDFALFSNVDDPRRPLSISACTADLESINYEESSNNISCSLSSASQTQLTSTMQLTSSGLASSDSTANLLDALAQIQSFSVLSGPSCNETIRFASSGDVVVGVYAGAGVAGQGILAPVLDSLITQLQEDGNVAEDLAVELCSDFSSRYSLGVYANTAGDLSAVQRGVQTWKNNSCIATTSEDTSSWQDVTFLVPSLTPGQNITSNGTTHSGNSTTLAARNRHATHKSLDTRDDTCTTVQVVSGDTCTTLAEECGITEDEFAGYNSYDLCTTPLAVGQYVCCSSGDLPDNTPQPDEDGYCYSYLVQTGDSCSTLSATYGITNDDIAEYNTDTWGWNGCDKLFADYYICLSSGYPPMPAVVANAVCGPQVNGTAKAPPGTDLSTLNECPLNACCDIWGQCGTTNEFCTISNSTTGAPGTAADGENGCISNCGTMIAISDPPDEPFSIAYFEAFDWQRECLHMSVAELDTSAYTHVHFAFATINEDFSINIDDIEDQLPFLQGLTDIKRIISIGGWTFSTDPSTYAIFRDVVSSEDNRQTLISNLIDFLDEYDLDGVDWDWEYPDEPDIPGIPAGSEEDTTGYFLLIDELKEAMPSGKTISITAPASFWYLQYFPIVALSEVSDYIVYMTYDLHGQWDYNNSYSDSGCSGGNCLRSHVNLTETINSLSMITKAGVPSNMIAVGVSSYGRSFQMTTAGCWTEECTYTGPDSGAIAGACTNTSGYLADYEIGLVLENDASAQKLFDEGSYSNIVVWSDTQWVAYMNETNKAFRKLLYEDLTFLGSADWAVDLQSDSGSTSSDDDTDDDDGDTVYIDPTVWASAVSHITALPGQTLVWPPMPLSSTTTISFPLWTTTVTYKSLTTSTTTSADGSTSTSPAYVYVSFFTVLTVPAVTTTAIPVWGVTLDANSTDGAIYLTSSVQPEPFTVTVTPVISGTTSIVGATQTTTSSGTAVIWGDYTYDPPAQTETLGGSTTIIGGVTLDPTAITVTPNPYPTTVPSTTDPVLNSQTVSWTSGDPPTYTTDPGCDGCGTACVLFCDSDCPSCPPSVFGSDGSSSSGDGDDDDDDDDDTSAQYTVAAATYMDESMPTGFEDDDELSSLFTAYSSLWATLVSQSTTATTAATTTVATTTAEATETPFADCACWDAGYGWQFEIYNILFWSTDDGTGLHDNINGCGGVTGWDYTGQYTADGVDWGAIAYFSTSFFISDGCVERGIAAAGGPSISCVYQGFDKRDINQRGTDNGKTRAQPPSYTDEQIAEFNEFYANATEWRQYVPMDWSTVSATSAATTAA